MKKAIAMISMDTVLKENCQRIHDLQSRFNEKMKFLEKQYMDARKKMADDQEEYWDRVIDRLKDLTLLDPHYEPGKHNLSFDIDENIIFLDDGKGLNFFEIIGGLKPQ